MENISSSYKWKEPKKIGFRFAFIFFSLFMILVNNRTFPFWDIIFEYPTQLLQKLIPWIGKYVLSLPYDITTFTNGSGDTTYDFVIVLTIATLSIFGTITWSFLDKRSTDYKTLYYWLTVAIRFYVGLMLIQYGMVKILKLQFPSPNFSVLNQTYGESSPMRLAWTFFGFSEGYNLFVGVAEISAILLLFRRTLTLGAIITLMTTLNIMAVNYFYDIPVKIISTALVTMTLFLLLNNVHQLWKFFLTDQAISLTVIQAPVIKNKWLRISKLSFKGLLIGYYLIFGYIDLLNATKEYGENAPRPKLYGMYTVDLFIKNKDTIPPLISDSVRWKQLIIEFEGYASIHHLTSKKTGLLTNIDTVLHRIDFIDRKDSTKKYSLKYEFLSAHKIHLEGKFQNDNLSIFMTRKTLKDYLLMNRGFHWINEEPYNR